MLLSLCKQNYSLNNTNIFSTCAKFYRCVSKTEMNYAFFKFEWNIVLIMFKKSYFLKWGSPPQAAFTAVPLTSQHTLGKAHVVASSSTPFTNSIQDRGACNHRNSRIVS